MNLFRSPRGALAATAAVLVLAGSPARADDPRDPTMTPDAIARDRAEIRRLNREQLSHVRERDAGYAQGWQDWRDAHDSGPARYEADDDYRASLRDYDRQRDDYDRAMADWRRDVAACRQGYYAACQR